MSIPSMLQIALIVLAIAALWIAMCLNILREYERAVVFRLGRLLPHDKGPGLVLILWPIEKMVRMSLRVVTWEIPPSRATTCRSR